MSPETIYQSIYVQGRGLRRELAKHLRTGRAATSATRGRTPGRIPGMVNISERPPEVEDRAVPGHWEGDLILGKNGDSAIGTLVERMTGFVMLLHLLNDHGALAVQEAITAKMSRLPEILRQTLTWDQGSEMANHVEIAAASAHLYFCDPHSLAARHQREHQRPAPPVLPQRHRPLFARRRLPRLRASELNNRPRKRLNWRTPAEASTNYSPSRSTRPVLRSPLTSRHKTPRMPGPAQGSVEQSCGRR